MGYSPTTIVCLSLEIEWGGVRFDLLCLRTERNLYRRPTTNVINKNIRKNSATPRLRPLALGRVLLARGTERGAAIGRPTARAFSSTPSGYRKKLRFSLCRVPERKTWNMSCDVLIKNVTAFCTQSIQAMDRGQGRARRDSFFFNFWFCFLSLDPPGTPRSFVFLKLRQPGSCFCLQTRGCFSMHPVYLLLFFIIFYSLLFVSAVSCYSY